MSVRSLLRIGHPLLLEPAGTVTEFNTTELDSLVQDMLDTMKDANGAGLAANQIGVLKRVVVFGFDTNPRYPDREPVPMTILINPEIQPVGDEMEEDWEGCLSVPGMRGWVSRYRKIVYRGFDPQGNPIHREVEGFHARVVQHECDHLDGVLYPQRITDMRKFGFEDELFGVDPDRTKNN
jgi:peptide deformylase